MDGKALQPPANYPNTHPNNAGVENESYDTCPFQGNRVLTRIHRWTRMDGAMTAEGGEGVTGAMIRALEFG